MIFSFYGWLKLLFVYISLCSAITEFIRVKQGSKQWLQTLTVSLVPERLVAELWTPWQSVAFPVWVLHVERCVDCARCPRAGRLVVAAVARWGYVDRSNSRVLCRLQRSGECGCLGHVGQAQAAPRGSGRPRAQAKERTRKWLTETDHNLRLQPLSPLHSTPLSTQIERVHHPRHWITINSGPSLVCGESGSSIVGLKSVGLS